MVSETKPNILFIVSDDQGPWALGQAGNAEIQTPNLDRLAAEGTRFENFFCASPVCSPARASLLTGQIPSRHGVQDWIRSGNLDREYVEREVKHTLYGGYQDENQAIRYLEGQRTYTEVLQENGYELALSGKWHLGDSMTPQHGFTHWTTIGKGGAVYTAADVIDEGRIAVRDEYLTTLFTDRALDHMETMRATGKPFYMHVAYTAPHSPWDWEQHPEKWIDYYRECAFASLPDVPDHPDLTVPAVHGVVREDGTTQRQRHLVGYYAAVSAMDEEIGRLLDYLEAEDLRENTVIVFMSDNGMCMGQHGVWGKGNGTFPQNMYEESVKVPCIITHPEGRRGQVSDALVGACDIYPTMLALSGSVDRQPEKRPGQDLSPLLCGEPWDQAAFAVCVEYGPVRMIRTATHKYVHRYPYGPNELYDLVADPGEQVNRVNDPACEALVVELRGRLEAYHREYGDPALDGALQPNTGLGQVRRVGDKASTLRKFYGETKQKTVKQERG